MNVQIHQTPFFILLPPCKNAPEEFLNLASIHIVEIKRDMNCVKIGFLNGQDTYYKGVRATEIIARLENLPGCKLPDE